MTDSDLPRDGDPDPSPATAPPPPAAAPRPRSTFVPLVAGGALAAVLGYVVAQGVPGGWPIASTDALTAAQAAQAEEIASLRSAVESQSATLSEFAATSEALAAQVAALPEPVSAPAVDLGPLNDRLAALEAQVAAIAAMPAGNNEVSTAALAAGLAALRAEVEALPATAPTDTTGVAAAAEEARSAADALRRQAALDRVAAALLTGAPFADVLGQLGDPPPALAAVADSGAESDAALLAAFPDAARAALDAAATEAAQAGGWGDRALAFLQMQTGARSVTARDGDSPDAILSRAEAALRDGHLDGAVAEVGTLPDVARAPMADWLARAQAAVDARAALAALQGG